MSICHIEGNLAKHLIFQVVSPMFFFQETSDFQSNFYYVSYQKPVVSQCFPSCFLLKTLGFQGVYSNFHPGKTTGFTGFPAMDTSKPERRVFSTRGDPHGISQFPRREPHGNFWETCDFLIITLNLMFPEKENPIFTQ